MDIREIIAGLLNSGELLGCNIKGTVNITSVTYDTRKVVDGALFVAVKGERFDGHDYVDDAVTRGAVAVVVQNPAIFKTMKAGILVRDSRRSMAAIANIYYDFPCRRVKTAAITGTNGKTTTSYILGSMLGAAFIDHGLLGTIAYKVGRRELNPPNTTPEAIEIASYLDEMYRSGQRYAVMEVSSHALSLDRVRGMEFAVAVFTNLSRDHLDYHGDMESYFNEKKKLFTMNGCPAVVNIDDPYGRRLYEALPQKTIGYGMSGNAPIMAGDYHATLAGMSFRLRLPSGDHLCRSPLTGIYNLYNIMAAAAAAVELGISEQAVLSGIGSGMQVPGRFEVVSTVEGVYGVIDYAHTDDALKNLLEAVRPLVDGRVITVFGCGGDRDRGKRAMMGSVADRLSDVVVVTSDNPRTEDPEAIINGIMTGVTSGEDRYVEPDRQAAIKAGVSLAGKGDVVVVAGKGHENYQILKDRTVDFDDRVELVRAMEEHGFHIRGGC